MEQDTLSWLHNKLSNSENTWSSTGIASQFNENLLKYIYDSFLQLEAKEKIQLLLSFLEIPLRNMESFKDNLNRITSLAQSDTNDWVKVAANIVSDYPLSQTVNCNLKEVTICFHETLQEVKTEVERVKLPFSSSTLPLECPYLNPTILNYMCGTQPAPVKHFTLRRKPKSAALRAKITQKASDSSNQKRVSVGATSSSSKSNFKRSVSQTSKITAVSSQCKAFSKNSLAPKKTKLLDIADQPLGVREQKKRKKVLAMEEKKKIIKQQKCEKEKEDEAETSSDTENEESTEETAYNDSATSLDEPNQDEAITKSSAQETPSYALLPDACAIENTAATDFSPKNIGPPPQLNRDPVIHTSQNLSFPYSHGMQSDLRGLLDYNNSQSAQSLQLQRELQIRVQHEQDMRLREHHQHQQRYSQQQQQQQQQQHPMFSVYPPSSCIQGLNMTPPVMNIPHELSGISLPHQMLSLHPTQPQPEKKGFSLSREHMIAAQEMFRYANRVTRAEKALILGFMAGARENPFPHQGPVITIKLSEDTETENDDGSQKKFVEMLFEMNYESGNWRRLKRTRVVNQQGT